MIFDADDSRTQESYRERIWKIANPYAVVHSLGNGRYEALSAHDNESAKATAEHVERYAGIGIRIYLGGEQVHYYGGAGESSRDWPSNSECVRVATESLARKAFK